MLEDAFKRLPVKPELNEQKYIKTSLIKPRLSHLYCQLFVHGKTLQFC